jgi:uncharacterized protein YukE
MKFDLLVDTAALKNVADKSASYTSEMNEILKGLEESISSAFEAWKGEESEKVKLALDNAVIDLTSVANSYNELEELIREINNKYLEIDDESASLLFELENR